MRASLVERKALTPMGHRRICIDILVYSHFAQCHLMQIYHTYVLPGIVKTQAVEASKNPVHA